MKISILGFTFRILLLGVSLQLYPQALAVTVTNLNDSGPGSIRQAIADTTAGGTIDFGVTGTVVLTSGQLVITNDLAVSGPGATNLTVSQNTADRILVVSNGNVTISGLTIANGRRLGINEDGGGIKNLATLTLRKCLITSNYAGGSGGGIYNQGALIVRDSLITSNTAFIGGGGIVNSYGAATTIIGTTICSNAAYMMLGGGGVATAGDLVVSNSTMSYNSGGIVVYAGTVVVSSSTLVNNYSSGDLGPDTSSTNTIIIRNSIIGFCAGGRFISEDYNLIQSIEFLSWVVGMTNHNIYG